MYNHTVYDLYYFLFFEMLLKSGLLFGQGLLGMLLLRGGFLLV